MKIGIITCHDLSRYFESKKDPLITHDDLVVVEELRSRGHTVNAIPWGVDLKFVEDFDYFIVRSPWDYMDSKEKQLGFFSWLEDLNTLGKLIENPIPLMLWNLDKHYLKDLSDENIEIVPTVYVEPEMPIDREFLAKRFNTCGPFVLKPCISAAAKDTFLIDSLEAATNLEAANGKVDGDFEAWRDGRTFMMQPFIASVAEFGEWSLVYLNGEFSHSVRKIPAQNQWLVQDELGGSVAWEEAPEVIIEAGDKAMAAIPAAFEKSTKSKLHTQPLYARVDVLIHWTGEPLIGEIEMVEPELFFKKRPPESDEGFMPAIEFFCDQIEKRAEAL